MDIPVEDLEDFERRLREIGGIQDILIDKYGEDKYWINYIDVALECEFKRLSPKRQVLRLQFGVENYKPLDEFDVSYQSLRHCFNKIQNHLELEDEQIEKHITVVEKF